MGEIRDRVLIYDYNIISPQSLEIVPSRLTIFRKPFDIIYNTDLAGKIKTIDSQAAGKVAKPVVRRNQALFIHRRLLGRTLLSGNLGRENQILLGKPCRELLPNLPASCKLIDEERNIQIRITGGGEEQMSQVVRRMFVHKMLLFCCPFHLANLRIFAGRRKTIWRHFCGC